MMLMTAQMTFIEPYGYIVICIFRKKDDKN